MSVRGGTAPPPAIDRDVRLALAARDGDEDALAELVGRHDARLRRLCALVLGNPHDADDAVQETWLRAMSAVRRVAPGDISSWLSVIARNEARRLASARRPTSPLTLERLAAPHADDPYEHARGRELACAVAIAVRALPAGQREVVLRDALGQRAAEAEAALGLTPGALRIRRHRGRAALRRALGERRPSRVSRPERDRAKRFRRESGSPDARPTRLSRKRSITMAIAPNDVNVHSVETADLDAPAGQDIVVTIETEAGIALHNTGGTYRVRMTMTDTTDPALLNEQNIVGNFGDADWLNPGLNTFTFTVPGAATVNRDGDLVEPQARVIANAAAPFDASHAVGASVLLTP